MNTGYATVLRAEGAVRAFIPALLRRLAFAMVGLVLLLTIERSTDSFAIAGTATGAFGLVNVIASPFRARLVDRLGRSWALNSLAVAFSVTLIGGALAVAGDAPVWLVVVAAGCVGLFPPPLGASMRVLWSEIHTDSRSRTKAYSVDAVSEELLFAVGPVAAVATVSIGPPFLSLALVGALSVIGAVGLTTSPASQRTVAVSLPRSRRRTPLRQPEFVAVLVALTSVGIVLGAIEITVPAVADASGSGATVGVLLGLFAAGSAAGGLIHGAVLWSFSPTIRLFTTGAAIAVMSGLLAWAPNLFALGCGLLVVGFFLAPSLVAGYLISDRLSQTGVRTEASNWINTAVNAGASLAASGVGVIVDTYEPRWGFSAGALVALTILTCAGIALLSAGRRSR